MSNKDDVADALRYTICAIQGGGGGGTGRLRSEWDAINKCEKEWKTPVFTCEKDWKIRSEGTIVDESMERWNYINGKHRWYVQAMSNITDEDYDEDDDFGTFNPCSKIDLSSITNSLNNVTREEVDKVRAKFGKGFHLEKKCSHNMIKKQLLTSFYLKCDKCGHEEG